MGTTPQLEFWRNEFGQSYTERNIGNPGNLRARIAMWASILDRMVGEPPESILEVGANVGNNLRALRTLTGAAFYAVEPIKKAREALIADGVVEANSVLDNSAAKIDLPDNTVDMAFTNGVLIHIHPDDLLASCSEMYRVSKKYIVCVEYFSDKAETIPYRGHDDVLFRRDFGGFWMDNFPRLKLRGYGFCWKRTTGMDNLTWWVFQKSA
ncbi:MAG: methyltransferase domain-containing protein [Pseudolabrys sp.]|nr:methyltransferase domain-containing protein [Pseudolabrys sp.]